MTLPTMDWHGRETTISMMELRGKPGEVIDAVGHGLTVYVEKNGKLIACLVPPNYVMNRDTTIIHCDGSIQGFMPLTFRKNLGNGGYGA